jgi:hypothetical protein
MSSLQFSGRGPSPADEKSISNKREKVNVNISHFSRLTASATLTAASLARFLDKIKALGDNEAANNASREGDANKC